MTNDHLATALAILRDAAVEKDDALPPELAKALLEEIERIEERAQALTEQLLETGGELGKVQAHNNSLREALNKRVTDEPTREQVYREALERIWDGFPESDEPAAAMANEAYNALNRTPANDP